MNECEEWPEIQKSQGDRNFYVGTPLIAEKDGDDLYCQPHHKFKDFVTPLLSTVFVYDYCAAGEIDHVPQQTAVKDD